MELHVSYCIYSKMAKKNYVWRDKLWFLTSSSALRLCVWLCDDFCSSQKTGIYLSCLFLSSLILRNMQSPIANVGNSNLKHKKPCGWKPIFASKNKPITHAINVDTVAIIYIRVPPFKNSRFAALLISLTFSFQVF